MVCQSGENLSIEENSFFLESSNEFAVRDARFFGCGADPDVPETAIVILLVSSVGEGVGTGMEDCFTSHTLLGGAAEAVSFYLLQNVFAMFERRNASFDSGHTSELGIGEKAANGLVGHGNALRALLVELGTTPLLRVEVVLAALSG